MYNNQLMKPLTLLAPAKLNLFLHVVGQREDGYHELQTIFQLINLYDELTFVLREDDQIFIVSKRCDIEKENNLIYKAYQLLQTHTKKLSGVEIHLNKKIPIGAGLGGGSSDAAASLTAFNQLFKLKLSQKKLKELGVTLGADVPVFIEGKTGWAEGIGEKLTPVTL
ncbi:MAG: 4-(cytidine 5'-diphospho)-2-C-methyl-D-erythritol kinase, partial [Gammaproteobacteria bacterium RIFOXYB2_FULL_38_6]